MAEHIVHSNIMRRLCNGRIREKTKVADILELPYLQSIQWNNEASPSGASSSAPQNRDKYKTQRLYDSRKILEL